MNEFRKEEAEAIAEMEVATKQLRSAYVAVINKFTRIAMNPDLKTNSTQTELDELELAQQRFDKIRKRLDQTIDQFRKGLRR